MHDPVLHWVSSHFGTTFSADGSIFGAQQTDQAEAAMRNFLEGSGFAPAF